MGKGYLSQSWRGFLLCLCIAIFVALSQGRASSTVYHFPIVVICSSQIPGGTTENLLLNSTCNFRSTRNRNISSCASSLTLLNFTLTPSSSSPSLSPLISSCVSLNNARNVTALDDDAVLEITNAFVPIEAIALLAAFPEKQDGIQKLDIYSDLVYTGANASLIVRVIQRPQDVNDNYLIETRPLPTQPISTVWIEFDRRYFEEIQRASQSYYWGLLVEPATWVMLLAALATIYYGSYRSMEFYEQFREVLQLDTNNVVESKTAILLPIGGSLMLLALFFFLNWLYYLLVALMTFSAVVSTVYVMWPYVSSLPPKLNMQPTYEIWRGKIDPVPAPLLIALPIAVLIGVIWLITKFWLLTDLLALCIGITALSYLRLPDLKISALILVLFFFYDIFWVFISTFFTKTGESVMVSVAMGLPKLPVVIMVPRLFTDGFDLLGMGDIILPGIFICFLYRFDTLHHGGVAPSVFGNPPLHVRNSYFRVAMWGYAVGFCFTFIALIAMEYAQPALLYLVPCTLIPVCARAVWLGEFGILWHGRVSSGGGAAGEARGGADLEAGSSLVLNDANAQRFEIDDETDPTTRNKDNVSILSPLPIAENTRVRASPSAGHLASEEDTIIGVC